MKALFLALAVLLGASPAFGYRLLDADDVSLEGYKIQDNRDAYWVVPGEYWTEGAAINLNTTILQVDDFRMYFNNHIHGETTDHQFREVGWQYEYGISYAGRMDFFYYHHSEHLLDMQEQPGSVGFPLQNYYGFRIHFYRRTGE